MYSAVKDNKIRKKWSISRKKEEKMLQRKNMTNTILHYSKEYKL